MNFKMRAGAGGESILPHGFRNRQGGFSCLDHCFKSVLIVTMGSVSFQLFGALGNYSVVRLLFPAGRAAQHCLHHEQRLVGTRLKYTSQCRPPQMCNITLLLHC